MKRLPTTPRSGFTLIELLVVIGLILVLATLALLISPRLAEDNRSVRTADQVSGWLLMAKQRAYRDQQTRGIRLLRDPNDPNVVRELQMIERPEDYRGGVLQAPSPALTPPPPAAFATAPTAVVFVHGKDLTNTGGLPIVEAGDFLVFDTLEQIPYNSHRVWQLQYFPPNNAAGIPLGGTRLLLATIDGTRPSPVNGNVTIPFPPGLNSNEFRFVRQPRPLAGEPNLQLPRDMVIDLSPSPLLGGTLQGGSLPWTNQPVANWNLDILFGPRGQVEGANSLEGKIVLRLRNVTRGDREGDQLYVVIYTRSGMIAAHPVDLTTDAAGNLADPYAFLRDGNSSGF